MTRNDDDFLLGLAILFAIFLVISLLSPPPSGAQPADGPAAHSLPLAAVVRGDGASRAADGGGEAEPQSGAPNVAEVERLAAMPEGPTSGMTSSPTPGRPLGAPLPVPDQEAGSAKAGGAGVGIPVSLPAPPANLALPLSPAYSACPSPCYVSIDVPGPTLAPLRPLASDCRLPCYGTARVGPASWYNAGSGYYAAIPGYLGGSVSVVVCTFPKGQANCHTLPVVTSCQCYRHEKRERVVDLSPAAFQLFQPDLLRGIVMVQITVLR